VKFFFYFILLILAVLLFYFITPSSASTNNQYELKQGTFFVYNSTTLDFNAKNVTVIKDIIFQKVVEIFPNGSFLGEEIIYNVNNKNYLPPSSFINNLSSPANLYYVPPSLLGEKTLIKGKDNFTLISHYGSVYVYSTSATFESVTINFTIWFNDSGVALKFITLQYGVNGLVSNTTSVLWLTNFINPNVKPPSFAGYTEGRVIGVDVLTEPLPQRISKYIILAGVVAIIAILLFRK
jgi:hypothetical protein